MIGTVVAGRYRIDAELGRGGMGIVYRAAQLPLERPVAVKVLRKELALDERARMRFEREARVASALAHPAAVTIHDFGEHEGAAFLVMELLEGATLATRIGGAPLPVAEAIELATQLAEVVAAAHAIGLVHRDLKPENVMLVEDRVRVLDFGLAFLRAPGPAGRMTREGVVVGTPEYLSPEQARGS
ncbi:MAG: serine/threonine protein kinase, partial [Myxococcales bacterium]|nr:serine/threonine protein kinase [Myxococcales bacterium]